MGYVSGFPQNNGSLLWKIIKKMERNLGEERTADNGKEGNGNFWKT